MPFKSLNHLLNSLQEQAEWQPLQHLLKFWPEVVGAAVAAHTRPTAIQRDILSVATSSAAWSQTLTFERQRILEKLNAKLPSPVLDIRFSTAQWQRPKNSSLEPESATRNFWREHPSCFVDAPPGLKIEQDDRDPNATFDRWAKLMQARSHGLPLCPQCHCPTPPGELQRWASCSICTTKQWHASMIERS